MLHILDKDKVHHKWDNSLEPALEINSGDEVSFDLQDASCGQITPSSTDRDLAGLNWDKLYPLGGPVYVSQAKKGDILEVTVLDASVGDWGWSGIMPNLGLLQDEFKGYHIKHWDLSNKDYTILNPRVRIPLDPFCGVMGVAPEEKGSFNPLSPGRFGGNMDIKHLTVGSRLLLPVLVDGALFSCGDGHAAQGDGEVCVSAIEAPLKVTLQFTVRKGYGIEYPQFYTRSSPTNKYDSKGYYVTIGLSPDLMEASKKSIRFMIDHLVGKYDLTREEAYLLCSIVVDLRISEVVDEPNWIVSAYLPLGTFVD